MSGESWTNEERMKIAVKYRVNQPVENFKLRVRIKQQRSPLAELFENEEETRDTNFLESEEITIGWQDKIFGPFETKFYAEASNCLTERQKDYHRRITEVDSTVQGSRLFTYTNEDAYYPNNGLLTKPYKSHLSFKNPSALPALRNRKPFDQRYNRKVVESVPTDTRIRTNHYLYQEREVMHVMADLSPGDLLSSNDSHNDSETLLCTVTFDKVHKTLTIDPDFTREGFYTIGGIGMDYNYWIENVSDEQSPEDLKEQIGILQSETDSSLSQRGAELFHEIDLPPIDTLRVFLNLDIASAHNFPYDALFVTYFIDLPKYWSTSETEQLSGRTQRSLMRNGTANFSYVAELCLDLDLRCLEVETVLPSWPQLFISVASLDNWTRYRIEGYASRYLPSSPGSYDSTLHTWRPVAGPVNSLRRFFTGGTSELQDITYCGIPLNHEGSKLVKPNLETVSGGQVKLQMNIAHQSRSFSKSSDLRRDVFERLSAGTLMSSVNTVLEQFKAARDRMIKARSKDT